MQWHKAPTSGGNGLTGAVQGSQNLHVSDTGGYLTINARDGPGMNLIYLYDTSAKKWSMVGLGTSTGIEEAMTSGDAPTRKLTYSSTAAYTVSLPTDISGSFGEFDWGGTYSSSKANWMCVTTNGWTYFFRSTSSNPACTSGYRYIYNTYYTYSGFALGSGNLGVQAASGDVMFKSQKVAPEPDTFEPKIVHNEMRDSHSRDRSFAFTISDDGQPPTGLETSVANGPKMWYRVTDANGTVGTWTSKVLNPSSTRTVCEMAVCQWTTSLDKLERGSSLEYFAVASDTSVASTGTNTNNTSSAGWSFGVGDPNKVFIIEWHDMG
jgi:hypothetical protein